MQRIYSVNPVNICDSLHLRKCIETEMVADFCVYFYFHNCTEFFPAESFTFSFILKYQVYAQSR